MHSLEALNDRFITQHSIYSQSGGTSSLSETLVIAALNYPAAAMHDCMHVLINKKRGSH